MRKLLVFLIFMGVTLKVCSQNLIFYGLLPSWSQTGFISKKFDYNFYASINNNAFKMIYGGLDYPPKILQVYLQPSIIYKYSPDLNFAASLTYNYQRNNPLASFSKEWRTWQQVFYAHNPFNTKGRLSYRLRFEQRFIKNLNDIYRMTTRLRLQIGYLVPWEGKVLDPDEFYFNVYNEFYFSLSNPPLRQRNALYSEDWIYAGVGYNTGKMGRIEAGPLYQAAVRNRKHERRDLALLQILWTTNFR